MKRRKPAILQAQGRYEEAETCYWRSIHRLPGRIYPYYLLAKLYAEPGFHQPEKLERVRQVVLTKEPKVPSTAVREMKEEVGEMKNEELRMKNEELGM